MNKSKNLGNYNIGNNVYTSNMEGLTLKEYCNIRSFLHIHHSAVNTTCDCSSMIDAASLVLESGIVLLSHVFKTVFPNVTYHSMNAKRRILQMPVVCLNIRGELYLMEKINHLDYSTLRVFLEGKLAITKKQSCMTKEELKGLLSLAESDRERECIRYAVFKSSGVTETTARRTLGLEKMNERCEKVDTCISEAQEIKEMVNDIAILQDQAILDFYGISETCIACPSISESDESDAESVMMTDDDADGPGPTHSKPCTTLPAATNHKQELLQLLQKCDYNWFQFLEENCSVSSAECPHLCSLENFFGELPQFGLNQRAMELVVQSHRAFIASSVDCYDQDRTSRVLNDEIVSDSDSDIDVSTHPHTVTQQHDVVVKKRLLIKRRARRLCSKLLAERRFLQRKIGKRTSRIIKDCPNIGNVIEDFVKDHSVGADAWRRTGLLTFDGNANLKEKVTYRKIQGHLEKVFKRHFSYGSVVELCVARNNRRRSSKRYRGVAKVTTRRARKGFNLRFNPDSHWSASFYKGLNQLQYHDGCDILNVNRDDATGFRLDTLTTCKQYANPVVLNHDVLTTRTDYVNRHPSILQTTSYNFTATQTTSEACVGVVKAIPVHQKNPAQHFADIEMLSTKEYLAPVFHNKDGLHKSIDCIRVDGSSDEGPSHEMVQYYWTEWHINHNKEATLVTTRSSGSSYLNRVELQNGCLSLGHANTFIPSTLAGSSIDSQTGKTDNEKLKENLNLAISAYISRVDGCPCGETTIKLARGADSAKQQEMDKHINTYLKGSKKSKEALRRSHPSIYNHIDNVWNIRHRHMVKGLPPNYIFYLKCCYKVGCSHSRCQAGPPTMGTTWFPGGPTLSHLPLPVSDPERPWGDSQCKSCKAGSCAGHYTTLMVDTSNESEMRKAAMPPSIILRGIYNERSHSTDEFDSSFVTNAAKLSSLTPEDTRIWLKHLLDVQKNRRRGAAKAAVTRQKKKTEKSSRNAMVTSIQDNTKYYCSSCGLEYEEDDTANFWIYCDRCAKWYCATCEGLANEPQTDTYMCNTCSA